MHQLGKSDSCVESGGDVKLVGDSDCVESDGESSTAISVSSLAEEPAALSKQVVALATVSN